MHIFLFGRAGVIDQKPLILFLYNVETRVAQGEASDLAAIQETAEIAALLIEILKKRAYQVQPLPVVASLSGLRRALKPFSPEKVFVFNYCDTFAGSNLAAAKIARLLDDLAYRHTGSRADVITNCIRKGRTKRILDAHGVPTPPYQVFSKPGGIYRHQLPAIVKPIDDDGSVGITRDSVVKTQEELSHRVEYLLSRYHQDALVEEYILGRELAVSIWGNGAGIQALPITEQDYSLVPDPLSRILTYESKWDPSSFEYHNIPALCPANLEPKEEACIADVAKRAYQIIGLRDFGRVDIRYRNGIPYVIDINEIPDLGPEDGFARAARTAGYSHEEAIEKILKFAMQREGLQCQ